METSELLVFFKEDDKEQYNYYLSVNGRQDITVTKNNRRFETPARFRTYEGLLLGLLCHLQKDSDLPTYRVKCENLNYGEDTLIQHLVDMHNKTRTNGNGNS